MTQTDEERIARMESPDMLHGHAVDYSPVHTLDGDGRTERIKHGEVGDMNAPERSP